MTTNLPDLSFEAITHLSSRASLPDALRAVLQLPVHLRFIGLRIVTFFAGVLQAQDDELREMSLASLDVSLAAYRDVHDLLAMGPKASLRTHHEIVLSILGEVMPGQADALSSVDRFHRMVSDHVATIRAGGRVAPDAFDGVLRFAYRDFHPQMLALSARMAEVGRVQIDERDARAMRARDRALSARERIDDISRTVRLISLNARVEAARAGTAGRAFGVIAHEIKTLSEQAEEASVELADCVEDMMVNLRIV